MGWLAHDHNIVAGLGKQARWLMYGVGTGRVPPLDDGIANFFPLLNT